MGTCIKNAPKRWETTRSSDSDPIIAVPLRIVNDFRENLSEMRIE